jgi:endonuclease III
MKRDAAVWMPAALKCWNNTVVVTCVRLFHGRRVCLAKKADCLEIWLARLHNRVC